MVQAFTTALSFEDFLATYPERGDRHELIAGEVIPVGAQRYIGSPKMPTLTVCSLVQGEYQVALFQGRDRIESAIFPGLELTAEQIFRAGR